MKKTFKKLIAVLMAVAMLCAMAVPAFADGSAAGSITIENAVNGQTYTAYKMFDVVSSKTETDGSTTYVYKVVDAWKNFFDTTGAGKDYITLDSNGQPTWNTKKNADYGSSDLETFAKAALEYAEKNNSTIKGTSVKANGTTATISGLDLGYYVVSTSLGALCSLNTVGDATATIREKNEEPTINKTIDGGSNNGKTSDAAIGDTVKYTVTINAKKGAAGYKLTDTMTKGLTFNQNSLKVTVNGVALTQDKDYTLTVTTPSSENDPTVFTVEFKSDYLNSLTSDTTILVTYEATVNQNAVIGSTGNTNTAKLEYGNGSTVEKTTTTYVWDFSIHKYTTTTGTDDIALSGAVFKLYKLNSDNTKSYATFNRTTEGTDTTESVYKLTGWAENEAGATELTTPASGNIKLEGLDAGTYYLEEVTAPNGYNKLTADIVVTITSTLPNTEGAANASYTVSYKPVDSTDDAATGVVRVLNNAGKTLPSTGGIGTTLFYVIGGGLMVVAAVLLITKKRMENKG